MTFWALSQRESLKDAWSLVEQVKRIGRSFGPLCFGALLVECEQRELFEHEIAILAWLKGAAGNRGPEMDLLTTAAKRVASMRLAKLTGIMGLDSPLGWRSSIAAESQSGLHSRC